MEVSMGHLLFKIFILIQFLFCNYSYAAKILIVTDEPSQKKAKEIKQLILRTPPFSLFKNFSAVIKFLPKESVTCSRPLIDQQQDSSSNNRTETTKAPEPQIPDSCKKMFAHAGHTHGGSDSEKEATAKAQEQVAAAQRLVVCDAGQALIEISGKENADRTIFVKESETWAGAGGSSITITTAVPPSGALHELLHSFGFGDEYEYASPCEADTYCPYVATGYWGNIAVLQDFSPYSSDSSARQKHSSQIPWYSKIKPRTLITTGASLGTPKKNEIGLHRVQVCDKAESKVTSWKPGSETTVMETLDTGYIPSFYYAKIAESLGAKLNSQNSAIVTQPNKQKSEKGVK